jgi:hypothetical protein
MNNKQTYRVLIVAAVIVCVAAAVVFFSSSASAESAAGDFSNLRVFSYPSGYTGFFDPDTGLIYVYDTDLHTCHTVRRLVKPGEPIKRVRDNNPETIIRNLPETK